MSESWISATLAYRMLEDAGMTAVGYLICSRANDGLISARARLLVSGNQRNHDVDVPEGFWWARGHEALTQNWQTGDFETWVHETIFCRAYGVEFREQEIRAMLPAPEPMIIEKPTKLSGVSAPAARCVQELVRTTSRTKQEIQDEILRCCRAGMIAANCASIHIETPRRHGADHDNRENCAIPAWFWTNCLSMGEPVLNWERGRFSGSGNVGSQYKKVQISGVEFSVSDILDVEAMLLGQQLKEAATEPDATNEENEPAKRGRKPTYDWEAAVTAIWGQLYRGDLQPQTQAEIELAFIVHLRNGDKEPSESTVRPYANRIWNEVRKEA